MHFLLQHPCKVGNVVTLTVTIGGCTEKEGHAGEGDFHWVLHQLHESPSTATFMAASFCVHMLFPQGRETLNNLWRYSPGGRRGPGATRHLLFPGQVCTHGAWWAQESSCFNGELINAISSCGQCALCWPEDSRVLAFHVRKLSTRFSFSFVMICIQCWQGVAGWPILKRGS